MLGPLHPKQNLCSDSVCIQGEELPKHAYQTVFLFSLSK
jgi:hypothetical protein